jgi:hypothetical protein
VIGHSKRLPALANQITKILSCLRKNKIGETARPTQRFQHHDYAIPLRGDFDAMRLNIRKNTPAMKECSLSDVTVPSCNLNRENAFVRLLLRDRRGPARDWLQGVVTLSR